MSHNTLETCRELKGTKTKKVITYRINQHTQKASLQILGKCLFDQKLSLHLKVIYWLVFPKDKY